nr:ARID DNA-binding domain-containing protein [Tanacetum cinerariifolium]
VVIANLAITQQAKDLLTASVREGLILVAAIKKEVYTDHVSNLAQSAREKIWSQVDPFQKRYEVDLQTKEESYMDFLKRLQTENENIKRSIDNQHMGMIEDELLFVNTSWHERTKEAERSKVGSCIRQISRDCKEMLKKKLDEIVQYNTTLNQPQSTSTAQDKYKNYKYFQCKQLGHIVKLCPIDDNNKDMDIKTDSSNFAREGKESFKPSKPSVMLNIKEDFSVNRLESQRKFLFTYGIGEVLIKDGGHGLLVPGVHYAPEVTLNILSLDLLEKQGYEVKSIPGPIPPTIKGIQIHLFDLYKLVKGLGGYLSVHFCQEFDTIGEILGLSKGNGEEIKEWYMKYFDVFTSYFKTARAPQKEYTGGFNQIIPKMPTKEEGKDRDCLGSHPWNFGETGANITRNAVQKAKGKVEHFGVKLEDTEEENDSQQQPILSQSTKAQDLQGMELGASTSRISDKEDSYDSSSDELIIIT